MQGPRLKQREWPQESSRGTEAERVRARRGEEQKEHGSGSAVSLGANESHLGQPAPGGSQPALGLLEQLQYTVRPHVPISSRE